MVIEIPILRDISHIVKFLYYHLVMYLQYKSLYQYCTCEILLFFCYWDIPSSDGIPYGLADFLALLDHMLTTVQTELKVTPLSH